MWSYWSRRRIFRRPYVARCWQYVHSWLHIFPVDALRRRPRCPARSSCAAHRGGSGVAMRQLSCSASASGPRTRFTSLGQGWSQHTMLVHVQGTSQRRRTSAVEVPECTIMLRICVMWSSWCKISLDCRRVVCDTMTGQTLVQHRPASIRLCNQCTVA